MEDNIIKVKFTPQQYFDAVKDKKQKVTDGDLKSIYDNCLIMLDKYIQTGQIEGAKKLHFHLECLEKELEIIKMGVDTFIYKDDIEEYIENIADDVVKIIELERYEREIPDEIVDTIKKVKDKFDKMYVVFTDYTGNMERKVQKERREKDPILFGTFENQESRTIIDRFYYLGDWIDEYCDLTLDKMVSETKDANGTNIKNELKIPTDLKELKEQINRLENKNGNIIVDNSKITKKTFFDKVKSIFKK